MLTGSAARNACRASSLCSRAIWKAVRVAKSRPAVSAPACRKAMSRGLSGCHGKLAVPNRSYPQPNGSEMTASA